MTYPASCRLPAGSPTFDQLFSNVFKSFEPTTQVRPRTGLPINVSESETHYTLVAEVPGVSPEGISLTITQDTLKLEVEKPAPAKLEGHTALLSEHRYGTYARTLNFRDPVDADGSEAKLEHGVLTISVPKVREAQPRKIEIKLG
ncbi:MAG: Hsp20/alpha crystallin family protein [Planctomycetes bacterium]|nr:Hsp20/alpha crystallin family protein [Planctomycetota bacterium]